MRQWTIALIPLALAACGPEEGETEGGAAPAATEEPAEEMAAASPVGVLGVDTMRTGGESGGAYLTDAGGRALYTIEDEDDPDACVDACAEAWPPYTRTATEEIAPTALNVGLDPSLVGTAERPDGATQVTYDGHPLYFYAKDTQPGQTTGQDVTDEWGEWYLVGPSGELVE